MNDQYSLIHKTVKSLLSEEIRKTALEIFAASIHKANSYGENKWGCRYEKDGIRLLIGSVIILVLHKKVIWLSIDKQQLELSDAKTILENSQFWRWDQDDYPEYPTINAINGYYSPLPESLPIWFSVLKRLHFASIERSAKKWFQLRQDSQTSHCHDFVEYLRFEVDKSLPKPNYESSPALNADEFYKDIEIKVKESRQLNAEKRKKRLEKAPKKPEVIQLIQIGFKRNQDVIAEALERANGFCESCKNSAPFLRDSDGTPYLEVHHQVPLAEGGEDTVDNAIALCPNCHRKAHFGKNSL